ncbi:MAG TPA: hypothetical protein VGK04_04785 [Thermoanaerobaculia bacterium]|jgi:hypothetical protein
MKPTLFLRIAAVLTLIHCIAHTAGGVLAGPAPGAQASALSVVKSMRFEVMGVSRSYWDFHFGYGLFVTITLLAEAILFWQLADVAKKDVTAVRPIIALFIFVFVAISIVSARFFFVAPVIVEFLIALSLAAAWVSARARLS